MILEQSREVSRAPTSEIAVLMTSKRQEESEAEQCDSSTSAISDGNDDFETSAVAAALPSRTQSGSRKSVSFSTLQIREYGIIPGDNPSVVLGCPLAIGWEYDGEITCSVEDYEESRPEPRTMIELRIPSLVREDKLRKVGFSRKEIQEGAKLAAITRNRRKRTEETMHLAPLHELFERVRRGTFNLVKMGKKRKEHEMKRSFSTGSIAEKSALRRDYSMRENIEIVPITGSLHTVSTTPN